MFDSIRSNRRWLMVIMMLLIVPAFAFFGLQGYSRFLEQEGALAKVDGQPITQQEFEAAQRDRADRLRQSFGADFDPRLLETPEARASILESIMLERALRSEADRANVVVTNEQLRAVIASVPAFQQDGRFNYDRYRTWLASQGMSEAMFEQRVRSDLRRQGLLQAVVESAIVPREVAQRLETLLLEEREIRQLMFPAEQFMAQVKVTDEQIAEYYANNRNSFETPENVRIEYVVLSPEMLAGTVAASEDELRAYYEQNKARFGAPEQRRASHILIPAEGADKAAARKTAELARAKVTANPGEFANVAREMSKDPGSAAQGGDLGFFGRGMMVKPFEDVVFSLKPGEISDIVETDFGFHIIQVTEVQASQVKPFEEVRAEIEGELANQQAQRRFAEAADQFTNMVYEQADSLKPAADKFNVRVHTVDALTRQGLPPHITPRVVEAIFSDESLRQRRNTQAIEVGSNTLVAARVLEHRPAAVRPLQEVAPQIRQIVQQREALRLAREAGEARLAQLRQQPSDAGFAPARVVSHQQAEDIGPGALSKIMRVPADKLPTYVGAETESGYLIAQVLTAKSGKQLDAGQRDAQRRVIAQQAAAADEMAYAEGLKARYNAQVLDPAFKRGARPTATDPARPK
jgi:peptidyl-prolyl cis-trans isomerase D